MKDAPQAPRAEEAHPTTHQAAFERSNEEEIPMKAKLAICIVAASIATATLAANVQIMVNFQTIVDSSDGQARLDKSIKLFFGRGSAPASAKSLGAVTLNKIAKEKERHDFDANCNAAVLEALIELQQKAKALGGDGVGNIVSAWQGVEPHDPTQAECHAGGTGGHLTLKAQVLKLE